MTILNLGCGTKTSPDCVNIDWSIHLRIVRNPFYFWLAKRFLTPERLAHLEKIGKTVAVHDLSKGIPYPDRSVDAVYHSHVLEHIDRNLTDPSRDAALLFTKECRRVLKPGGILRVVVPNLEFNCRSYLDHLARCAENPIERAAHDEAVECIIGPAVAKEASGSSRQRPALRRIENLLLGDARKRGQTHQWEYDRVNLSVLFEHAGFQEIRLVDYRTSLIPQWNEIGLDRGDDGAEYKPFSLYMEATANA